MTIGSDHPPGGRLLLVSEYFPPRGYGGGETSAFLLARGLAGRGFEVWVLTSRIEGLADEDTADGFRMLRRLSTGRSPYSIAGNVRRVTSLPGSIRRHAARLTSRTAFDAVVLLNSTSIVPLSLGVPTVAVVNGYTPFCPKGNLHFQERTVCDGCAPGKLVSCITRSESVGISPMPWFLRFNPMFWLGIYAQYRMRRGALAGVDRFVALSGFIAGLLRRHGVEESRIERIYNIAEIEDGDEVPEELAARLQGRRVVSFLGKLEKVKGPDLAIRGFAAWRSGTDLLLLAGEGSQRPRLETLCRELGVADAVCFAGQVAPRHVPFVYRSSWAIVLPSQCPEAFSRVVMEAAYFRRPLLASDRGGNLDLPAEHLFADAAELAAKLDRPPVPDFAPYDPEKNLDRFVRLLRS